MFAARRLGRVHGLWAVLIVVFPGPLSTAVAQDASPESPFNPRPSRIAAGVAEGRATLSPARFSVAEVGEYTLRFWVGREGIAEGGGLLVDFPKAWFSNPVPLIKAVQTEDSSAPHYVEVSCSREGAGLELAIDHQSFDGSIERFRHVMRIVVTGRALEEGDGITVIFSKTTSPIVSGSDEVRVAVDAHGDQKYGIIAEGAGYAVSAGDAVWAMLLAPSQGVVGEPVEMQLTVLDALNNVVEDFRGAFEVAGLEGAPVSVLFRAESRGRQAFSWIPEKEGFYWPVARGELGATGGPIRVTRTEPSMKIYWGDIHSHTRVSKDGIGGGEYAYARDVARLDFYASSEHAGDDAYVERSAAGDSISAAEWEANVEKVKRFYEPGRFVTLLAYECSLPTGHHNVYYRGLEGVPWPAYRVRSVDRLWDLLAEGKAITIPHHLGVQWGGNASGPTGPELQPIRPGTVFISGPRLDWARPHHQALRPALEIYSAHGQSEFYNRNDPLAYESVRYTSGRSADGPHYARDAWAAGHAMGVVAASDDHNSHPGLSHQGLTAVIARELTREAVFDAIASRNSYGTTGQRILLEFKLGGVSMGQEGEASGKVAGNVIIAAPSTIRFAEILAFEEGGETWETVIRWEAAGRLIQRGFELDVTGPTTFYLRVELEDKTRGRVGRAWSSPIWLRPQR
ncbi:MAG: DUF3604 domain-containing protein [Candidatus Hydrogenedentes bacterium]|nr:DUF3604 domain-containing protein [Candidatus Hydrogenedentota bacterium]